MLGGHSTSSGEALRYRHSGVYRVAEPNEITSFTFAPSSASKKIYMLTGHVASTPLLIRHSHRLNSRQILTQPPPHHLQIMAGRVMGGSPERLQADA